MVDAPTPEWFQDPPGAHRKGWRRGWTTSAGPDFSSPVTSDSHADSVSRLATAAGLREGAWVRQVHGAAVLRAKRAGCLGEADALWTTRTGLGVIGRSADCPLVLVAGHDAGGRGYYGFAHASWRSTVSRITARLLADMAAAGMLTDSASAVICPSAGPCCYEVGPEVEAAAYAALGSSAPTYFTHAGKRPTFDLWRANTAQLEEAGLTAQHIFNAGECTICGGAKYPSYRRDGNGAGRFAGICGGV